MYIYNPHPSGSQPWSLIRECLRSRGANRRDAWAHEGLGQLTLEELSKKFQYLSFLPHFTVVGAKPVALTPSVMDPHIYDGPANFRIAPKLQDCLKDVMKKQKFRPIKVALVDLTKNLKRPEFAGSFDHRKQVYVASVGKIATMLGALQLRQDLQAAWNMKGAKTLIELFGGVREDWAATQRDPGGKASPFTQGLSLRGKLVLWNGGRIALRGPKAPRLETIFRLSMAGLPIEFSSTGETTVQLQTIVDEYHEQVKKAAAAWTAAQKVLGGTAAAKARLELARQKYYAAVRDARKPLDGLGFWERLGITIGGDVPVSNYVTSTIVRDVGFPYIASTLLQAGLYDTNRGGGLWLGADFGGTTWRGPLAGGGGSSSATAGSLAAFMTLLAQRRLVSPEASGIMQFFMRKIPGNRFPGTGSWFEIGLRPLGPLQTVLAKVGLYKGADECAYIERQVDDGKGGKKTLRYVAVGLRATSGSDLEQLIVELDRCIRANNGL